MLREVLDRDQRRELERDGHFHVAALKLLIEADEDEFLRIANANGERVYRLKPGA